MRKPKIPLLVLITVAFAAFTLGLLLGRNMNRDAIVVNVPQEMLTEPTQTIHTEPIPTETEEVISFPIDINLADAKEFTALPGIGDVLGERILAYREEHGAFTAVEELLNVEGIGKKRLEEILDLITIGG